MTDTLAPSLRAAMKLRPSDQNSISTEIDGQHVTIDVVMVTPDIAATWLTKNTHNRNPRERPIKLYAADMAAGDWCFTGAPITFDDHGNLLDGQHRLHALIAADVSLPFVVIRGLANSAQDETDNGIPRKFYDVLTLRGEPNASHLAALVRRVTAWESGHKRDASSYPATHSQLLRTLERYPNLRDYIQPSRTVADKCDCPASVIALLWWVFDNIDSEDAEFFFRRLGDGQGLVKGDPIFELRRTLANTKQVRGERSQTYLSAIVIKAWNAFREGNTVGLYRWKPGGSKPEAFPEPI